ncbi:hypothetical protein CrRp3_cds8 [Citrobacter phage vB_CroP_CrRp3]|uniref:Uncharacterized protein n=1 Tax=Citrobacter phage vB_CroP_CrRp3 TaxID=2079275 RepID=A0A2K9VAW9_9CAUD|nr:hypothetical protein HOS73_gp08 [Citrobacter phage vB_CroP_CrRp3]AUV59370.1 hypothetical protein CrRp3_cds8 [Citrobacter phage vB_CroP_CrRp3]
MVIVSSKKRGLDKIVQTGLAVKEGKHLNTDTGSMEKIVETGKQAMSGGLDKGTRKQAEFNKIIEFGKEAKRKFLKPSAVEPVRH